MAISVTEMYELAKKGNSAAQYNSGLYALDAEMYSKAIEHFYNAAEQNNAYALYALGVFCELGRSDFSELDENERKKTAKGFFELARLNGHPDAAKAVNNGSGFRTLSAFEKTTNFLDINYTPQKPSASGASPAPKPSAPPPSSSSSSAPEKVKHIFDDGDSYEGYAINGIPNGKGKYTWADGDIYEGDYVDGKEHGKGKMTFTNGDKYEGDYIDGNPHGKGKYTYKNGDKYEGGYVNGNRHGKGKYTFANGKVEEGEWADGKCVRSKEEIKPETMQDRIDRENRRKWQEKQDKKNRIIAFFSPFSIVDSDSGEGSTTIIGGLIAIIAGAIAWKFGGWIAAGIAAIAGGVFGGKFLGEIIHVKLLKVIIYIVIFSALATGGMYLYPMLGSTIGKSAVTRTEQTAEEKAAALANLAGNFLTVYSETINIYSGASNTSRKIKTMYKGNTITATGNVAGVWVPVESGNDKGFVFVPSVKHANLALIEFPYDAATASSVQLVNQMTNAQGLSIPRGTVVTVTGTFDNSNMSIEYKNGSYQIDNALAEALLPMLNENGSLIPAPERPAAFNRKLPFKATVTEEISARNFNNSNLFSIPARAEVSIVHRYNSSVRVKYNNQEAIVQWKYLTVD